MNFVERYKEELEALYDYLDFDTEADVFCDNVKKDIENEKLFMAELNNNKDVILYKDGKKKGVVYVGTTSVLNEDETDDILNGEFLPPFKKLSLKEVMDDRNISVKKLASVTGIAIRSLYDYVNDINMHVTSMDASKFWRIAEVMQLSIEEIRALLQIEKFELYSVQETQEDLLAESFELDKIIDAYFYHIGYDNLEIRRLAFYNSYGDDDNHPIYDYDLVNLNTIKKYYNIKEQI